MQTCQNCNNQFSWGKIYKAILFGWGFNPIPCDYCSIQYTKTILGRLTFILLSILPTIVFVEFLSPFDNVYLTISVGLIISLIGSTLAPYFIKLERTP